MTETVKELLDRLEQELSGKITNLRRELHPLERELVDVRRARQAIETQETGVKPHNRARFISVPRKPQDILSEYRKKTMKQLAVEALREHFPNGATANELLEFFAIAWGRNDIARESFSPQLSRLRAEKKVTYDGKRWLLISVTDNETPPEDQPGGVSEITDEGGKPSSNDSGEGGLLR